MAASTIGDDDDWEVVDDDGFVFKRKKCSAEPTVPPVPDQAANEKNRRARKKRALLKLKEKYQREIELWEHLSNILKTIQEEAQNQELQSQLMQQQQSLASPFPTASSSDSTCERLLDEHLALAEAQEAIIQDVSNLCDVAEAICDAQELEWKKEYINLPIWDSSPSKLLASMCEGSPRNDGNRTA